MVYKRNQCFIFITLMIFTTVVCFPNYRKVKDHTVFKTLSLNSNDFGAKDIIYLEKRSVKGKKCKRNEIYNTETKLCEPADPDIGTHGCCNGGFGKK